MQSLNEGLKSNWFFLSKSRRMVNHESRFPFDSSWVYEKPTIEITFCLLVEIMSIAFRRKEAQTNHAMYEWVVKLDVSGLELWR